ncbi:MAG TPA: DUF6468 domain-containing protein [Sphingobium sp.]|nr:DUF6468 domain-containing protein [Sphingobium sp.]
MTFATFSNLIVMLLCVAVIVQSRRLSKSFNEVRSVNLRDSIAQLDRSTGQAKAVLAELKALLATEGVAHSRSVASGEALRDELSVMIGIGNAVAERIVEAAALQSGKSAGGKVDEIPEATGKDVADAGTVASRGDRAPKARTGKQRSPKQPSQARSKRTAEPSSTGETPPTAVQA